jgi:DNA-binding MarR family transcriptional regulator
MTPHWDIDHTEPRRPLPALLTEVKEAAISELHRRLADEGHPDIRPGHGCVFRFVDDAGTRLTDLAERAGLTKQAVGEVVYDLEAMDYVERVPDPADGRAKIIRLTEKGRDGQRTAQGIFADIERRWGAEVGEELVAALRRALEEIIALERGAVPHA